MGAMTIRIIGIDKYSETDWTIGLSDGEFECFAFACMHDINIKNINVGDISSNILTVFECTNVMRIKSEKAEFSKGNGFWEYRVSGQLIQSEDPLVQVGEFVLELCTDISKDILVGDWVEFSCARLNLVG